MRKHHETCPACGIEHLFVVWGHVPGDDGRWTRPATTCCCGAELSREDDDAPWELDEAA